MCVKSWDKLFEEDFKGSEVCNHLQNKAKKNSFTTGNGETNGLVSAASQAGCEQVFMAIKG